MKIAGLIVGIFSFVLSLISWLFAALPVVQIVIIVLAIAGIVLSAIAGKKEKSGAATCGLVFSIIATVFATIWFMTCGLCVMCAACELEKAAKAAAGALN